MFGVFRRDSWRDLGIIQPLCGIAAVMVSACATQPPPPSLYKPTAALIRTNLEQLASIQRAYASSHQGTYFSGTLSSSGASLESFVLSPGVQITVSRDGDGWNAVATGDDKNNTCVLYVNTESVEPPAQYEGSVACS